MFMNLEIKYKRLNKLSRRLTVGLGRQMKGLVCAREGQENK